MKRRQLNRKINTEYEQTFLEETWQMAINLKGYLLQLSGKCSEMPFCARQICRHRKKTLTRPPAKVGTPLWVRF